MKMSDTQLEIIQKQLRDLTSRDCFYKKKLEGVEVASIRAQEDFEILAFTW
jgi:phenylacetate-CoA ligase